ncbi:MAG: hypothetical protein HWE23_07515 [Rhodobacteraceae bacterium]|nr:hypothetical protein [Paracoccaceae bacterium]
MTSILSLTNSKSTASFQSSFQAAADRLNEALSARLASKGADDGRENGLSKSLMEELKESVEVATSLKEMANSSKNNARSEKIARIKEKIEQLKEKIKFATPEQAARLAKELKQLAKDFKGAAKSLTGGGVGETLQTASLTQTSMMATTGLASMVGQVASGQMPMAEGLAMVSGEGATSSANMASQTPATFSDDVGQEAGGEQGDTVGGSVPEEVSKAIEAYQALMQPSSDNEEQNAKTKQVHAEELRKIGRDLKVLAERIKKLAREDDDDAKKQLEAVEREIKAGEDALNEFALQQNGSAGAEGTDTTAQPATPVGEAPLALPTVSVPTTTVSVAVDVVA